MYEEIIEQLKTNCDCISENEWEDSKLEANITEFLDLISTMTCWKTKSCENLLLTERTEIFDIDDLVYKCGECDNGLVIKQLYFDLIQPDSITVKIIVREGIQIKEIEIPEELYTFNPYTGEIYIDLSDYLPLSGECSCEKILKLIVTYDAGYETLPECLFPILCDFLDYVIDMNKCTCGGCSTCESDSTQDVVIVEGETDNEEFIPVKLQIRNLITTNYMRQLEFISLCGDRAYGNIMFNGLVV